jgi:hypothetical protein
VGFWGNHFFHQSLRLRRYWRRSIFFDLRSTCQFNLAISLFLPAKSTSAVHAKPDLSPAAHILRVSSLHSSFFYNNKSWGPHNNETARSRSSYVPAALNDLWASLHQHRPCLPQWEVAEKSGAQIKMPVTYPPSLAAKLNM